MRADILVYGATGLSGSLTVQSLVREGFRPILAGRNEARVHSLAKRMQLRSRVFDLLNLATAIKGISQGVDVVLNAAGPFNKTAHVLASACIETGVHYLDIAGEAMSIECVRRLGKRAREKGIMLMPGAGFDVVPSDCLAAMVASRLPNARWLDIAVRLPPRISAGSVRSFVEHAGSDTLIRRNGKLTTIGLGVLEREFDFGDGPRSCSAISWGDVATSFYTNGIPNVTTYLETTATLRAAFNNAVPFQMMRANPLVRVLWDTAAETLYRGPSAEERRKLRSAIVAEVRDERGHSRRARLEAGEPYALTAEIAARLLGRVAAGDFEPGFQTPARVFGAEFVLSIPGVRVREF